jgi:Mrp family chromosome partitioning ATPase
MTKKQEKTEIEELVFNLPSATGEPAFQFPEAVAESMRQLITRLSRENEFPVRLGLVSALKGEGVTYTAYALAAVLAYDTYAKVCVIDLNWRSPSKNSLAFGDKPGLAKVLSGEAELEEILIPTGIESLYIIPAGTVERSALPGVARSSALRKVLADLELRFDHLILDLPAILSTSDAVPLASLANSCCLVIHQGVTSMEDIRLGLDEIAHLKVCGVVLNRVTAATPNFLLKLISQA